MIPSEHSLVILGIDPGYDRVGWAAATPAGSKLSVIACGCIETTRSKSVHERYREIDTELNAILANYHPHEVAIESLFFSQNRTTALAVSEARGVMIARILQYNLPISEYTPTQIKQTVTGHGGAPKAAVEKMVLMQTNLSANARRLDDTIDAVAVALTHAGSRKLNQLTSR